jgi:excisionase family DNA binding protein
MKEVPDSQTITLTIEGAAQRLAVSPTTVRRLLERGELRRVKLGRSVRVLAISVNELAERGGCEGKGVPNG